MIGLIDTCDLLAKQAMQERTLTQPSSSMTRPISRSDSPAL